MNRLKIFICLLLMVAVTLSGCIDYSEDMKKSNVSDNVTVEGNVSEEDNISVSGTIISTSITGGIVDRGITSQEADWCLPANTLVLNQEEFTVIGITNYIDDRGGVHENVCKAVRSTENETSTVYFDEGYINKDSKQFLTMKTYSAGKNTHANASISISVMNKTNKT